MIDKDGEFKNHMVFTVLVNSVKCLVRIEKKHLDLTGNDQLPTHRPPKKKHCHLEQKLDYEKHKYSIIK